jgi:L-rhamnose mutarotase
VEMMRRVAFKMKLKPGFEQEYKRRHDEIWPELADELSRAGVYDYSIFLDRETLTLFAFQKLQEGNTAERLPENEVVKRWWKYMKDIMETNTDNSPISTPLEEVFHLD